MGGCRIKKMGERRDFPKGSSDGGPSIKRWAQVGGTTAAGLEGEMDIPPRGLNKEKKRSSAIQHHPQTYLRIRPWPVIALVILFLPSSPSFGLAFFSSIFQRKKQSRNKRNKKREKWQTRQCVRRWWLWWLWRFVNESLLSAGRIVTH